MLDFRKPYINKGVSFGINGLDLYRNVVLSVAFCGAFGIDTLNQHALDVALHHAEIAVFILQGNGAHDLAAFAFDFFRNLIGHGGGFGAATHGIFKGVNVAEPDFACKVATFLEIGIGLARETYDDVGRDVEIRAEGLDSFAHFAELGGRVKTVHLPERVFAAALQAYVHVWCQFFVLEEFEETVGKLVGFNGGDAHAKITIDVENVFNELLEIGVFVLITSHVDSGQNDFLEAVGDDFPDVVVDFFRWTTGAAASYSRNDAVGAVVVAAVVNLDETARVKSIESWLITEKVAVVAFGVTSTFLEMVVNDVENGGFAFVVDDIVGNARLEQLFLVIVDHASRDGNQCIGVLAPYLMDGLAAFLVALVGDGAGIDNEDIGAFAAFGNFVAVGLESRCQSVSLKQVDAAAQCLECNLRHYISSPSMESGVAAVTFTLTIWPMRLSSSEAKRMTILPSV